MLLNKCKFCSNCVWIQPNKWYGNNTRIILQNYHTKFYIIVRCAGKNSFSHWWLRMIKLHWVKRLLLGWWLLQERRWIQGAFLNRFNQVNLPSNSTWFFNVSSAFQLLFFFNLIKLANERGCSANNSSISV